MRKANIAVSSTKQAFLFYLVAAFMYLALTIISMVFVSYMEKRASRGFNEGIMNGFFSCC